MFEQFFPGKQEEKAQLAAEKRQMNFAREQQVIDTTSKEEMIDLQTQEGKANLIRWQQELDDENLKLIYYLKGFRKNTSGQWFLPADVVPLCNDRFIEEVVFPHLTSFTSRNLINSNYEEKRLLNFLKFTANDIASSMTNGYDVYGIEFRNYDNVYRLIKNTISPGAFRSLKGWTKKVDSTIYKNIESSIQNKQDEDDRRSFLGFGK